MSPLARIGDLPFLLRIRGRGRLACMRRAARDSRVLAHAGTAIEGDLMKRWQGAPTPVRTVALGLVLVLVYGTAVHVVHLVTAGFAPYPGLPGWLKTYFTALAVLDPLAAVLLARRCRSGVVLTVAVLVSNSAANGFANYVLDPAQGVTAGRAGHAVITLLAGVACAAAPALWRSAGAASSSAGTTAP